MRFTKTLKYNLKRALPILTIAGAGLMASCDKEDEPNQPTPQPIHDMYLEFYAGYYDEITPENIQKYAKDKTVRTIYLSVVNSGNYRHFRTADISAMHTNLNSRINIAPEKIRGKGNFRFMPGCALKEDSLWFVQQGWTVNQR